MKAAIRHVVVLLEDPQSEPEVADLAMLAMAAAARLRREQARGWGKPATG